MMNNFFIKAHLGDYDPEVHGEGTDYMTEFKFIPTQVNS